MYEFLPLIIVGSIIGAFSIAFILAYAAIKNKKESIGYDRNMSDAELIQRLMQYATILERVCFNLFDYDFFHFL